MEARRSTTPLGAVVERALDRTPARPWPEVLAHEDGLRVIAEVKRSSPSAGVLATDIDAVDRANLYVSHGATAVSVLTDSAFEGRLEDLERVAEHLNAPVLRKDFVIDPYQVWESRASGADAVLVILAALDDAAVSRIADTALEAGLSTLIEIHSREEAERARRIAPRVVGVNARNLDTLDVSRERGLEMISELRETLSSDTVLVAESGVRSAEDAAAARFAGADSILVGESLMRSSTPGDTLEALIQGGIGPRGTGKRTG